VQITLEDELVKAVDLAADRLDQSRSACTRDALRAALAQLEGQAQERQHREGYLRQPVSPGEFSDFEDEQVWID
jgi:metal-responsive CopG/Arc/MetJ family transcriptional regulator